MVTSGSRIVAEAGSASRASHRVLMICYYYPPVRTSGSIRSVGFSLNLKKFGWEPTVLTVKETKEVWNPVGGEEPVEVPVARASEINIFGLSRFLHGALCRGAKLVGVDPQFNYFQDLLCLPDAQIAWNYLPKALSLSRNCDVIYVTCSPFSAAFLAVLVKLVSGKPLVVDFRDVWTLNPHIRHCGVHRAISKQMERLVLKYCDRLIFNTEGSKKLYEKHFPEKKRKFAVVPNGYDSLNPADGTSNDDVFKIMHVGTFYGSRHPFNLLRAVASHPQREKIEFIQIGAALEGGREYERKVKFRLIPPVIHEDALKLMKTASLLYLRQGWERGIEYDIAVAAKTYEYLATGLPILYEGPPGDNAEIVKKYCSAAYVVESNDEAAVGALVEAAFANRNTHVPKISPDFVREFDRTYLTGRLAQVLNSLC